MSKYKNDRERYIMRRARSIYRGRYGVWHAESSTFGVFIGDAEGAQILHDLVERDLLHFSPADHRDFGWRLSDSEIEKLWARSTGPR